MIKTKVLVLCDNPSLRFQLENLRDFFCFHYSNIFSNAYSFYICHETKLDLLETDVYERTLFLCPSKTMPLYYPLNMGAYILDDFTEREFKFQIYRLKNNYKSNLICNLRHLFTTREWLVLKYLFRNKNYPVPYSELESLLSDNPPTTALREVIYRIRKKLGSKLKAINIKNIRNIGYILFDDI